jgi:CO/xanthine dehydrogenase Mo-binding subunit
MAIGKSISMIDSRDRVTGAIQYTAKLKLPGMLIGKVFRSPVPYAIITKLDVSEAEKVAGVVAIVTAADFEGDDTPNLKFGSSFQDQPIVAGKTIRYLGEPVALIAAESMAIAEKAMDLINLEYEELTPVFDAEEAMKPGAPTLHEDYPDNCLVHSKIRHGDIDEGFAKADKIIEETYTSPVAQQVMLEPQVAVAQIEKGKMTIWTATQSPFTIRKVIAATFKMELENVRVIVPPLGGGFGAKGNVRTQPMAAALAWKVDGRPVKLLSSRSDEFFTVTKHAAKIIIKTGVKNDGDFTARKITIYWNGGAYASSSVHLVPAGSLRAIGPYRIPAVEVDSYGIYTNLPTAAAYRGAMSSQGVWGHESHMDTICQELGLAPLEFWNKNLFVTGDIFATGETLHDIHFIETLESVTSAIGWENPLIQPEDPTLVRGRGLAVMMKNTIANSTSECKLEIDAKGIITLYTSTVEMGQGGHTALAQIAADVMGVGVEQIRIFGPDTDITPPDAQTASSRSTHMMGNAVLRAGKTLKTKLIELAAPHFGLNKELLSAGEGKIFKTGNANNKISYGDVLIKCNLKTVIELGSYSTNVGKLDPETGQGVSTPDWHQGAGACEIEVDIETGKITILRYHSASFAGQTVNPKLAGLQNDGNVIFGIGAAILEEMAFDEGQLMNPNLSDYMIPSFLDIPVELENETLEDKNSGMHGIGEMTLPPVAPAIANALYDAIGVRIYDLPITPEKVLRAIQNLEVSNE